MAVPKQQASVGGKRRAVVLGLLCTVIGAVGASLASSQASLRSLSACLAGGAGGSGGDGSSSAGTLDTAAAPEPLLPLGPGPGGHDLREARSAAAAAAAPDRPGRVRALGAPHGIPRILHRIYMADPQDQKRANFTHPIAHEHWIQSCAYMHSRRAGWRLMFWDWANVHALLRNHFPWFQPFFTRNATKMVEKSDLARYMVLHRVGGLYLDSDVECWREGGDLLEGFDLVAQATNGAEGTTNAMMAARPGLDVFAAALRMVQGRVGADGKPLGVIARTANGLFADALVAAGVPRGPKGVFFTDTYVKGAVYRMHPPGSWFHPCQWWEVECRRRLYRQRVAGRADMTHLVGWHRMVGSWMAGKEDGVGIVNTTAELCGGVTHSRGNGQVGGWVAPLVFEEAQQAGRQAGAEEAQGESPQQGQGQGKQPGGQVGGAEERQAEGQKQQQGQKDDPPLPKQQQGQGRQGEPPLTEQQQPQQQRGQEREAPGTVQEQQQEAQAPGAAQQDPGGGGGGADGEVVALPLLAP